MSSVSNIEREEEALEALYNLLERGAESGPALRIAVQQYPDLTDLLTAAMTLHENRFVSVPNEIEGYLAEGREKVSLKYRPIVSLRDVLRRKQITVSTALTSLKIPKSLLAKLDDRLIEFDTIPASFLTNLSKLLGVSQLQIERHLQRPPIRAEAYKGAHVNIKTESFQAALGAVQPEQSVEL